MGWSRTLSKGCFPQLCSALESCTATQYADQTVYSISAEFGVSADSVFDYEHSWSAGKEVLATHKGKYSGRVKTNTINDLALFECNDTIIFKRTSISTGRKYKTSCAINCTQHSHLEQQKVNGTLPPDVEKEIPHDRSHWMAAAAVLLVVVTLGVVGMLGFLCYRKKQRIPRECGHVYDRARMEDRDVEAGNT